MSSVPLFLLPADPLAPRRPDPQFVREGRRVRELGGVVRLIDHDALLAGRAEEAVRAVPAGRGAAWYRGWMVPVAAYAELERALGERDCSLLTSAAGYAEAHELPGWYGRFEHLTPASSWLPGRGPDRSSLAEAAEQLGGCGPAVVKDYVKSRKHEWHEACFVPDLADLDGLARVVDRFAELQGEFLAGGVVLRRFEEFAGAANGRTDECRVWWLDGAAVLIGPHPDAPSATWSAASCPLERELDGVRSAVGELTARFVTTDLARRADGGSWRVVEVGDGQVSELPDGVDADRLFTALLSG